LVATDPQGARADFKLGYRPGLDGIRAIAIVMVMWHHSVSLLVPSLRTTNHFTGGFIGVDLFFVLSGFLITSLLVSRTHAGTFSLLDFYRRRAARLLPALAVLLVGHVLLLPLLPHTVAQEVRTLAAAVTYTSNWLPALHMKVVPSLNHLWSLAIEEQFYVLWPIALVLLLRRRPATMFVVLGAAAAGIAVWRAVLLHHYAHGYPIVYERTDARADTLLIGALLALVMHRGWRPAAALSRIAGWTGLAVLCGYVLVSGTHEHGSGLGFFSSINFPYQGGFTLFALGAAGLILAGLGGAGLLSRLLSWRPVVLLGQVSYSLYLWHVVVFALVAQHLHAGGAGRMIVAWPAAIAVAALSRVAVELPVLARVKRVTERTVPPVAESVAPAVVSR
jgi:peptidoglycan/LPS O-acetylase OafA/YrhL